MEIWFIVTLFLGILIGVLASQITGVFAFRKGQSDIARVYLKSQK